MGCGELEGGGVVFEEVAVACGVVGDGMLGLWLIEVVYLRISRPLT